MERRLRYRICALALAGASMGLTAQTRPVPGTADQPLQAAPLDTATLALRQAIAPDPAPDAPRVMPVNWVAAREDARTQSQFDNRAVAVRQVPRFPQPTNDGAQAVTQTRLPVLIPASTALGLDDPAVQLFPQENFYTLSITGADIVIEVFGTRLAHATVPDAAAGRRLRTTDADGYRVTATRYGRELSFNRYGAAYSITVECGAPQSDARCTSDDYVRRLAQSLLIAAGNPGEGED